MDILKSYCKHLYCLLPPVEKDLCGYHLTNPPEDESHYSVYRITLGNGRAFVDATEDRIADRIKEHTRTPNSPIGQGIKLGAVWRGECLDTGLSRQQALSLVQKEKARLDVQIKHPVGRPKTSNLKLLSIKIPQPLLALIEKATGNSLDSRNQVICKVLEQYFTGQLVRADDTPLDYSNSIDFDAPMVRRALPLTSSL
ncbi:hypothetical protein F4Y93_04975 [Candidatus Poribacteria bacterium]|nr:hypothetical protein [Candidatus Poribacteria bacterium]